MADVGLQAIKRQDNTAMCLGHPLDRSGSANASLLERALRPTQVRQLAVHTHATLEKQHEAARVRVDLDGVQDDRRILEARTQTARERGLEDVVPGPLIAGEG